MITAAILETYKPQRIFLLQGDSAIADALSIEMRTAYEMVHTLMVSRFTVDDAARVSVFAIEGDGSERVIVVYFSIFSPDAAQILLKSLEEPDEQTTIIFVTPYPYIVPMTIRSRVVLIQTTRAHTTPTKHTRADAIEYVKKELSSDSDDDAATRRANAVVFLDELETQCKSDPHKSRIIYEAKHMLFKANLPTKYVMEYVVTAVL